MITVALAEEHYELVQQLVMNRIRETEDLLAKGLLNDDSSLIGEATAKIRSWECVLKDLKRSVEQP